MGFKMYKCIIVGVDGSKYAEAALDTAIELAKLGDSSLGIIYIYGTPETLGRSLPLKVPEASKAVSSVMEPLLKKYEEKAKSAGVKDVKAKIVPAWGGEAVGLINYSDKHNCKLLVIGTRGLTGLKRTLLGSVAEFVLKNSECDVLAVRS